jgi:hypothetical protein
MGDDLMRSTRTSAALASLLLLLPAVAVADEPEGPGPSVADSAPDHHRAWLLAADALAAVVMASPALLHTREGGYWSGQDAQVGLLSTGIALYCVGGPIVHLAYGHVGAAAGSLALRVGLPLGGGLAGGLIGAAGSSGDEPFTPIFAGALIGGVTGMLAASIVDSAWLVPDEAPRPVAPWTPVVSAWRGGAGLGLAGTW